MVVVLQLSRNMGYLLSNRKRAGGNREFLTFFRRILRGLSKEMIQRKDSREDRLNIPSEQKRKKLIGIEVNTAVIGAVIYNAVKSLFHEVF